MHGQQVILAGNAGGNVITRERTKNGKPVLIRTFSLAVSNNPKAGPESTMSWYQVECWGHIGDMIAETSCLKVNHEGLEEGGMIKGLRLIVAGRLEIRDSEEHGTKVVLVADEIGLSILWRPLSAEQVNVLATPDIEDIAGD